MLIKGHRKARLHSEGNEKLLKVSKTRGMEGMCVRELVLHFYEITLAALWGIDGCGQECKRLEQ